MGRIVWSGQVCRGRSTCMHLGRDRVICAYEGDGVVVDPGPDHERRALLDGLELTARSS